MDITSQVAQAINSWLESAARQLLGPALQAAGRLIFQTPSLDRLPPVQQAWSIARDATDGLLVIGVLVAGILVMASGTLETRYTAKLLIPRLVLAAVAANLSLLLCGALIDLANALTSTLLGPDPSATVWQQLGQGITSAGAAGLLEVLVGLAAALLAVLLVVVYVARDLILLVATVLAPLALVTYALPQTEELARLWWRIYCAGVFVEVIQAVLVLVSAQLVAHTDWLGAGGSGLVTGLVLITVLYLLLKLPFAAYRWAFGHSAQNSIPAQAAVFAAAKLAAAVA